MTLNEEMNSLNSKERVKIVLKNGAYYAGTVKSAQKFLSDYLEEQVITINITYEPVRFRIGLCKQTNIIL